MPKYQFDTTHKITYLVTIEAEDEEAARAEISDWIADDFEDEDNPFVVELSNEWTDGEMIEIGS
jgi:hypothetical protein